MEISCAIVGVVSAFPVKAKVTDSVGSFKKAIKDEKPNELKDIDADNLQLFLAKQGGKWLVSRGEDGKALMEGRKTGVIQELMHKDNELTWEYGLEEELLKDMPKLGRGQIHVLVKVPRGIKITIKEDGNKVLRKELQYYQERGREIQRNCRPFCGEILDKIDKLYAESTPTFPFICVEGSSGMGKSQLAFALGGEDREHPRPYYYWPATAIGSESQKLYKKFQKVSAAFNDFTHKDNPTDRAAKDILNSWSRFYQKERLWTYGFIRTLLKHSEKQDAHMIRFEGETLKVECCDLSAVKAVRDKMDILPFFILDEMAPNVHMDGAGKNLAAFQRNVFRVCGLIVVVVGTGAKITNLVVSQSGGSRKHPHMLMTIISRFPPYQLRFEDKAMQDAWKNVIRSYPVVEYIAKGSRGMFS